MASSAHPKKPDTAHSYNMPKMREAATALAASMTDLVGKLLPDVVRESLAKTVNSDQPAERAAAVLRDLQAVLRTDAVWSSMKELFADQGTVQPDEGLVGAIVCLAHNHLASVANESAIRALAANGAFLTTDEATKEHCLDPSQQSEFSVLLTAGGKSQLTFALSKALNAAVCKPVDDPTYHVPHGEHIQRVSQSLFDRCSTGEVGFVELAQCPLFTREIPLDSLAYLMKTKQDYDELMAAQVQVASEGLAQTACELPPLYGNTLIQSTVPSMNLRQLQAYFYGVRANNPNRQCWKSRGTEIPVFELFMLLGTLDKEKNVLRFNLVEGLMRARNIGVKPGHGELQRFFHHDCADNTLGGVEPRIAYSGAAHHLSIVLSNIWNDLVCTAAAASTLCKDDPEWARLCGMGFDDTVTRAALHACISVVKHGVHERGVPPETVAERFFVGATRVEPRGAPADLTFEQLLNHLPQEQTQGEDPPVDYQPLCKKMDPFASWGQPMVRMDPNGKLSCFTKPAAQYPIFYRRTPQKKLTTMSDPKLPRGRWRASTNSNWRTPRKLNM